LPITFDAIARLTLARFFASWQVLNNPSGSWEQFLAVAPENIKRHPKTRIDIEKTMTDRGMGLIEAA